MKSIEIKWSVAELIQFCKGLGIELRCPMVPCGVANSGADGAGERTGSIDYMLRGAKS